mmetsp:Transcript_22597/g.19617  ORF Transcript_22597/g.19617 Transcript_22597/m.19617 type:complete len:93 (+) Transcript_22597:228-506(+)
MHDKSSYNFDWNLNDLYGINWDITPKLLETVTKIVSEKEFDNTTWSWMLARCYLGQTYEGMHDKSIKGKDVEELTGLLSKKLTIDMKKGGVM